MSGIEDVPESARRRAALEFYGDPSEYPDCPMPDWLKRRLALGDDDVLVREAAGAVGDAWNGRAAGPTAELVRRGLEGSADGPAVFAALTRWLAPRSPHQVMAGWAQGLYTPRRAVSKAVEHGLVIPALRDRLRCVRSRPSAGASDPVCWTVGFGDPVVALPERARSLYRRERALIDAWTARAGLLAGEVAVGGGAVLAARWGHRHADDVDVVVQGGAAYAGMVHARRELEALAESRGGGVVWVHEVQVVRVVWLARDLKIAAKIEFFGEVESPPGHAERLDDLEGRPTRTLGTSQILWANLNRCRRRLGPEDVFDLREAGRRDPGALAAAVNAWPRFAMLEVAQALRSDAAAIGAEIESGVRAPAGLGPGGGCGVARDAGDAVELALYREVAVRVEKGLVRVDRVVGSGRLRPLRWPADETAVEAERTGVARCLDVLGMSVVLSEAASVASRTGEAAEVWCARNGETVRWVRAADLLRALAALGPTVSPPGPA